MNKTITLLIAFFAFVSHGQLAAQASTVQDFTVTTIEGETINLYEKLDEGKHVVLHFFHAYCPFCTESMPFLDEEYTKYGCNSSDLYFIHISQDGIDSEMLEWKNEEGFIAPIVSGLNGGGESVFRDLGVIGVPGVMLIDPDRTFSAEYHSLAATVIFEDIHQQSDIEENPDACSSVVSSASDLILQDLTISPNPASDNINVAWSGSEITRVEIHNIVGQRMSVSNVSYGSENINIPVDNFECGSYILTSYNQNGVTERAIFQKF